MNGSAPDNRARSRVVGHATGGRTGPTLVCVAGLHGDEPSGVEALARVFSRIDELGLELRGEFVGLAGNLRALEADVRYLDEDLNRIWTPDRIERVRRADPAELGPEGREQRELLDELHGVLDRAEDEIYFLDLHTSSASGGPFVCIGDTLRNRRFALRFPVPVILGLEECIDGALLEYVNDLGVITMGVEAGQHRERKSVERHEAFLWLALAHAGLIERERIAGLAGFERLLASAAGALPPIMEVRHRHPIEGDEEFRMEPGFSNFQSVRLGDLLARDREGEIRAGQSGRILLPLYQGLGSDGFFLTRDVRPFWLRLSALLRRLHLDGLLHWLPGIRRHPERKETLLVDSSVARWYTLEIFHLLGYRKRRVDGDTLVVSRRRFDHRSPHAA